MLRQILDLLRRFFNSLIHLFSQCFHSNKEPQKKTATKEEKPQISAISINEIKISTKPIEQQPVAFVEKKTPEKMGYIKSIPEPKLPSASVELKFSPIETLLPSVDEWIFDMDSIAPPVQYRKGRQTHQYKENLTAALQLPYSNDEVNENKENYDSFLAISTEYIKEHAARRLDLYFYLLVALYKTKFQIKQGDTILQHGKGSTGRKTHACHSSLFPTLTKMDQESEKESILFSGSHFIDSLNSTVELPKFVNNLDSELEGKINHPSQFRKKSLEIMQRVSNGKNDPIQGLREFTDELEKTFNLLQSAKRINNEKTPYLLRKNSLAPKYIKIKLIELVRSGTRCDNEFRKIKPDLNEQVNLLLRLKPDEIAKCHQSEEMRQQIYREKIKALQKEIYTTIKHSQPKTRNY